MISCAEAVRQLWDYLENDVDTVHRDQVEEHLAFCRRCCGEVEFAEALQSLLRSSASPHVPAQVETRLVEFLEDLEVDPMTPEAR